MAAHRVTHPGRGRAATIATTPLSRYNGHVKRIGHTGAFAVYVPSKKSPPAVNTPAGPLLFFAQNPAIPGFLVPKGGKKFGERDKKLAERDNKSG